MAKKTVAHSADFEKLKEQYDKGYMTKATLKKWVQIHEKRPDRGITAEEYKEITGEDYE